MRIRLIIAALLLLGVGATSAQSDHDEPLSAISNDAGWNVESATQCVSGPFSAPLGQGWFVIPAGEGVCEASKTPLHGPQLMWNGAIAVWNDEGYVWFIARPEE